MRTAASTPRASATRSSVAKCTDVLAPDSISLMVAGRTPAVSASLAWDHPRASRSSRTRNRIGVMRSIYALAYAATRVPVRRGVGSPLRYRTLRRMVLQPLTERITMSARTAVKQRVSQGQVNTPGERVHYRYIPLRDPLVCENGRRQRSRIIVTLFDNPEGIHSDAVSAPLERGLYISIRGLFTVGDAAYSLVDSNGRMLA